MNLLDDHAGFSLDKRNYHYQFSSLEKKYKERLNCNCNIMLQSELSSSKKSYTTLMIV